MNENVEKALSIFEQIKQKNFDRVKDYAEKILKTKERKEKNSYEDYIKGLKVKAAKYSDLMNDRRYVGVEFLVETKKNLQDILQRVCLESTTYEGQSLETARISAEIRIIELLITKPEMIIDKWVAEKEKLDKRDKNG